MLIKELFLCYCIVTRGSHFCVVTVCRTFFMGGTRTSYRGENHKYAENNGYTFHVLSFF